MRWLDFLFPPRVDEIALRDVSQDDFLALVAPQIVSETQPSTVTLLPFSDTRVRVAIHEAKYRGSKHAFMLLALALAEYLRDADDIPKTRFDLKSEFSRSNLVLVPIPLGKVRRKERGYNQIHEVILRALRSLGEEGKCTFILEPDLLIRTRETESQVSLPRHKREENMRGAFLVSLKLEEQKRINSAHTYIVIDDVITTGATLQAAIDALKKAGAEHIIPLALAH